MLTDLGPTILSLVGVKIPEQMDGLPFLGVQRICHYQPQRPMIQDVTFRKNMALMRELYSLHDAGKLNPIQDAYFQPNKPPEKLYDTDSDPHELRNLAADTRHRKELERLRAALDELLAAETDWGFIAEPDMVRMFWPGNAQPVTAPPRFERYHGMLQLHSSTEGASIAYQIGDAIGTDRWQLYHHPLAPTAGTRVRATAIRIGYKQSAAVDGTLP